jgi:hypothetical protein
MRRPAFFRSWLRWGLLAASAAALAEPAMAAGVCDARIAIYSSICLHRESGDLSGYRVFGPLDFPSDYPGSRHFILFQEAASDPRKPIVADAQIDGNQIVFGLRLDDSPRIFLFTGTITPDLIEGRFADTESGEFGGKALRLRRQTAVQARVPDCS